MLNYEHILQLSNNKYSGLLTFLASVCLVFASILFHFYQYKSNKMETAGLESVQRANDLLVCHKDAVTEKYVLYSGDKVRLHGLKNNGLVLNDLYGSVDSYIPTTDRYLIAGLEGRNKGVSVKAENIAKVLSADMINADPMRELRNYFFAPGMVFEGTIQIPGEAGYVGEQYENTRQTYKLTVVDHVYMHEVASDGTVSISTTPQILARHRAYEDEQYVFIRIIDAVDINSALSIEYADGETTCHGTCGVPPVSV